MRWSTHVVLGADAAACHLLGVPSFTPVSTRAMGGVLLATAFGSLLQNLDASEPKIKHLKFEESEPLRPPAESLRFPILTSTHNSTFDTFTSRHHLSEASLEGLRH